MIVQRLSPEQIAHMERQMEDAQRESAPVTRREMLTILRALGAGKDASDLDDQMRNEWGILF